MPSMSVSGQGTRVGKVLGFILLLPFLVVTLPFLALVRPYDQLKRRQLRRAFEAQWASRGKCGLLVYSNSPNWQRHVEEKWMPRIGAQLVVVNWSERASWERTHPLEAAIVRRFLGERDFNPAAVVFPPGAPERIFRFRPAFRDLKHGTLAAIEALEGELFALLDRF